MKAKSSEGLIGTTLIRKYIQQKIHLFFLNTKGTKTNKKRSPSLRPESYRNRRGEGMFPKEITIELGQEYG